MTALEEAVKEINYKLPIKNHLIYLNWQSKEAVEIADIVIWHSDRDELQPIKEMTDKDNYKARLISKVDDIILNLKTVRDGIFNSMNQN